MPDHLRSFLFDRCRCINDSCKFAEVICSCLASDFVVLVLSEAVLSETVLVLDDCLNCCDAVRWSRRFAVTCEPMGRIAILDRSEYGYEQKHERYGAPESPL